MRVKDFPGRGISIVDFPLLLRALSARTAALLVWFSVLAAPFLVGCGSAPTGPERFPIGGTVTREGIPIDSGTIMFSPTVGGVGSSGLIVNGEYQFTSKDGLPTGKYKVTILQDRLIDPSYVGKKTDAPLVIDDRFKKEMPYDGWAEEAEVSASSTKIDFAVDP